MENYSPLLHLHGNDTIIRSKFLIWTRIRLKFIMYGRLNLKHKKQLTLVEKTYKSFCSKWCKANWRRAWKAPWDRIRMPKLLKFGENVLEENQSLYSFWIWGRSTLERSSWGNQEASWPNWSEGKRQPGVNGLFSLNLPPSIYPAIGPNANESDLYEKRYFYGSGYKGAKAMRIRHQEVIKKLLPA